ncbi:MAG: dipeptidase [Paracoccaceae bacterium]
MTPWQAYLDTHQTRFQQELLAFIAIPSVSAQPEHAGDVRAAGQWVIDRLQKAGMENARMMETGGHPVVYADWMHAPGKPTILIYGHFDVQPAEPFDLWTTPPFQPEIRDGRVYGRGATDDKGGMLIPILALEAMLKNDALGVNVKCLFEGQEEIGSPQLPEFIAAHRDLLSADMIFSADSMQYSPDEACLFLSAKGLVGFEVTLEGTNADKHSGLVGNALPNPAMALAHLLAGMKDAQTGRVLIEGFYDGVPELTEAERAEIARVPFDEAAFVASHGAEAAVGEAGYTPMELMGVRPSLDINGIWGGYQGEGTKTVHPARASAKITCRLVPGQTPADIFAKAEAHIRRHAPRSTRVSVSRLPGSAEPFGVPHGHNASQIAGGVLHEVYGMEPYGLRAGGSVPILAMFLTELGVHATSFGFSLMDENLHAPDEFFRLQSFERGQVAYCRLFEELARGA